MSTLYEDLPLTNFPSDGVDTFPTYLNVTATDGPLIQQYMEAMNAGNQVLANQILSQIPAAEQKVIKATDLNKVMQATLAVERFYKDDIYDYIAQEQQNWENIINQFTYKGIYSSGNTYQKYNMVGYTTNGSTLVYIAIQDVPTGNAPLNETFWRVMTIQGQEGEPGVGLSYRLEWNPATQYEPNQAVTYDGVLWMALQTNINVQPGTNDNIWEKVLDFTVTTYPIQPTQPTNLPVGGLWFNTEDNPTQYYYLTPLQSPASAGEIGTGYQAYDSEGNVIMGTATLNGPTYTAGDGIEIAGDVISTKISTDANNKLEFGTDDGLLVDTGVDGAVQGNFVGFGANGQLVDSGSKATDFAPSGFGLGELCEVITDWNTAVNNGWYRTTTYNPNNNAPDALAWYGYTICYSIYLLVQVAYHIDTDTEWKCATRFRRNDVWSPWEYFQYPLTVGTEYRTTERFNNKPVYAKAINMGSLSQGLITVAHNINDYEGLVRVEGQCNNGYMIPSEYFGGFDDNYVRAHANATNAYLYVNAPDVSNLTSLTAILTLYYTKTTD